jgi:hypothetical protein
VVAVGQEQWVLPVLVLAPEVTEVRVLHPQSLELLPHTLVVVAVVLYRGLYELVE